MNLLAAMPADWPVAPVRAIMIPEGLLVKLFPLAAELAPFVVAAAPVVLVVVAGVWLIGRMSKGSPQPNAAGAAKAPGGTPKASGADPKASGAAPKATPNRRSRVSPDALASLANPHREAPQDADIMVLAPPVGPPGDEVLIQVFVHTPDREAAALAAGRKIEPTAQQLASRPLELPLSRGDKIKLSLESEARTAADAVQQASWNGRWVCFYFMLRLPDARVDRLVTSTLRVFVNGMPAGIVVFRIKVQVGAPDLLPSFVEQHGRALRRSFISYASEDRVEVLKAVQVMNALKLEYFQDLLSLSPGDRWQQRLFSEIDRCDVFLLFWSQHARASQWVVREAEYALRCARAATADRQLEIVPILLEGPPPPSPPDSLREIHFNDPIRYVIFAAEHPAPPPPPPSPPPSPSPAPTRLCLCIGPVTRALEPGFRMEPQLLGSAGAALGRGPIAETALGPDGALGLRNLSAAPWRARLPNGASIEVAAGHAVRLAPGLVIDFGGINGEVRSA